MCDRCSEIDKKIAHLREVGVRVVDQQTTDGIDALIAKLEAEKRELHPQQL